LGGSYGSQIRFNSDDQMMFRPPTAPEAGTPCVAHLNVEYAGEALVVAAAKAKANSIVNPTQAKRLTKRLTSRTVCTTDMPRHANTNANNL
jgi:hypothetical protein